MKKQPDQELHDELFRRSQALGYSTYTHLPPDKTPYPFVSMGDVQLLPRPTKSHMIGRVAVTVHVWGTIKSRKTVSDMIGRLMESFSQIKSLNGRQWFMDLSSSSQIIKDNSTVDVLYHGIINLEFRFN